MSDRTDLLARGTPDDRLEEPALPLGDQPETLIEPEPAPPFDEGPGEPGRALALADFSPPALGAGERLVRLAYRMGLPAEALHPFRKSPRPRLLATVDNPLRGDAVIGTALRAGHFLVHGARTPIADVDFGGGGGSKLAPPLERMLHGFTWLAGLDACAPRDQCAQLAERILAAWLAANPRPGKGAAWRVGVAGRRLLGWLVHAPLLLSGPDKQQRARTLNAIAETARWLDRHVGKADDRLDEVTGWAAIVAAGLLLPGGNPRRLFGEAGLLKALGEFVGDDGGVLSRSPLAQIEGLEVLLELRACYRATRRDPPGAVDAMIGLLVPPLLGVLHGDGSLSNWQGAGAIEAERIEALVAATGVRARPLRDARQWGYQRLTAGRPSAAATLIFDAAPPPLARHARHGCASTLAFELSHGRERLIVNCGGAAFAGGLVPLRLAQGLRATAAHSTLTIDDFNSTAVLINGKLGSGVSEVEVDRRPQEGGTRLEASHDGYAARYGLVHRRILVLRDDGTELLGQDLLEPVGRRGRRGKIGFALRFHLAPGVSAAAGEDGLGVTLALPDGALWQFRSAAAAVEIDDSLWVDGQGRPLATQQLVIQGKIPRSGESFGWLLKKMR